MLAMTISCEQEVQDAKLENNINFLDIDLSDGLSNEESLIIEKAKLRVLPYRSVIDGIFKLSIPDDIELKVSENLMKFINLTIASANNKVNSGRCIIKNNELCINPDNRLKKLANKLEAIVPRDGGSDGGGGSYQRVMYDITTDWYKVYEEDGYSVYEYTNTTSYNEYRYEWVEECSYYEENNLKIYIPDENTYTTWVNKTSPDEVDDDLDITSPKIIETPDFGKEITGCLKDKLLSNNNFKALVSKFVPDGSEFNLVFGVGSDLKNSDGGKVNGLATYEGPQKGSLSNKSVYINIDSDMFGNSSALEISRTILHEVVHAYMYEKLYTNKQSGDVLDFRKTWDKYVEIGGQHTLMAEEFIDDMAIILKDVHASLDQIQLLNYYDYIYTNDSEIMEFYKSLAWQGLKKTCSWDDLTDAEKEKIENNAENARLGSKICVD